jgi:hypothetical protein
MGNGTSKERSKERSNERSKERSKNKGNNGMFNKELKHAFELSHSHEDPYIPLFLIQSHSLEPEGTLEVPESVDVFHYCKKGCILRTKKIRGNTMDRSISMEYACLKELDIHDKYEKNCPNYHFYVDEATKEEGGLYICLDKEIHKIFTFEPGQTYSMGVIIHFIESYVKAKKIHIGILSCRTTNACSDVIVALPGSPSKHANKLNQERIHRSFRRTVNKKGEENRKGIHPAFAMMHTRKRKTNSY